MKIEKLNIASADAGHCEAPGGSQSELIVAIYATPRGYRAEATAEYGSNQGYFRVDYSHGPWVARGDTPAEAAAALPIPAEYAAALAPAITAAVADAEGVTWRDALHAERDRLTRLMDARPQSRSIRVCGVHHWPTTDTECARIRRDGIAACDRALARLGAPLSYASDSDILAAARARGLAV